MDHHTNSRPKFQPIRVKELLHFCESDDDESEDKVQNSETESDSEDAQPLSEDSSIENDLSKSLPLPDAKYNNSIQPTCEVPHTNVSSKPEESTLIDSVQYETNNIVPEVHVFVHNNYNNVDLYDKYKEPKQESHRTTWSVNLDANVVAKREMTSSGPSVIHEDKCNAKSKQSTNLDQLNYRNVHAPEQVSQKEHKSKHVTIDIRRQSTEEQAYKSDLQSVNQYNPSKKQSHNEFESIVFAAQHIGNASKPGACNSQGNVNMKETMDQKPIINEEKAYNEAVPSVNKSLSTDIGSILNSADQLVMQTPLKHVSVGSSRPDPCFSRRNIAQTPQNKMSNVSRNQGLTPATVSCHWSQNSMRQTPLQNKCINFKDSVQTPKNSVQFMANASRHETPRYLNTEGKVRQPLTDAGSFTHNNVSSKHLLQGSQLFTVNEAIPAIQTKLPNKSLENKSSVVKQVSEASETVHMEPDINECLKENKYPNEENKETIMHNKIANNQHHTHSNKDSKTMLKSVPNESQDRYSVPNNQKQQQESKGVIDNASNVQFSMPSSISKSRQSRTIFVKGKEYLILGVLGQGMSGEVLRVQDLSSLELCAIKCVNLNRMDKDSAQGCLEEISLLYKLQAPCIVKMFDYEIKNPMVYVVMEMGDTDLSRLLKTMSQEKQIPLTMILYYWTEMLTAVKHIHDNNVIHSDLKPANFLLVRGRLKLIDFGIASSMNADMTSVVKNCPIGTLNYISPEALMDTGGNSDSPTQNVKYKISFKSDVWSLGCILYSLVYGHTPFHHIRSQWAKVNAITNPKPNIHFPATMPSGRGDTVIPSPPILIDVMRKCLQHNPKARPTVAELLQVQYIPAKQERLTLSADIPANILVKIKHALNENEWRQLVQVLENKRFT